MEINDYSTVVNAVSNLNASVLNADTLAQQAKEKIPDTFGDILIGDASREILGKVLTPLAKGVISKLGLGANDVKDLAKGKFKKVALRKLKQKLGMKEPEEQKEPEEGTEQPTPEQPTPTPEQPTPTPETGSTPTPTPEQPTPEQPTPTPEQPIENVIEDAPEDLGEPTMTSAFEIAGRSFSQLLPSESLLAGLEASGVQQAQQAAQAARQVAQQASQAIRAPVEDAIEGLPDLPGLRDSLAPMREMMARTAPAVEEAPVAGDTQEFQSLRDALSDPGAFKNYANENFPEFADKDDDFFEEARGQLRDLYNLNVDNPIVNRPISGQQLSDENTGGEGGNLVNEDGGNIQDLANNATGSSSGSGDAALSNVAKNAAEDATEDIGEDAAITGLDSAAGATAEIPGIGEIIAPLLALAGGLATLFGHKAEAAGPTLNPSFQFL